MNAVTPIRERAAPTEAQLRHASRNLPRYTSYPTALAFVPGEGDEAPRG